MCCETDLHIDGLFMFKMVDINDFMWLNPYIHKENVAEELLLFRDYIECKSHEKEPWHDGFFLNLSQCSYKTCFCAFYDSFYLEVKRSITA